MAKRNNNIPYTYMIQFIPGGRLYYEAIVLQSVNAAESKDYLNQYCPKPPRRSKTKYSKRVCTKYTPIKPLEDYMKAKTVSDQEKQELLRLLSLPREERPGAKMRYKNCIPYKYDR